MNPPSASNANLDAVDAASNKSDGPGVGRGAGHGTGQGPSAPELSDGKASPSDRAPNHKAPSNKAPSDKAIDITDRLPAQRDQHSLSGKSNSEGQWLRSEAARYPLEGGFDGAERDWNSLSRQVWQLARLTAGFLMFAMLIGWPLGDYLAHRETFGTGDGWSLVGAYPAGIILFALVVPALVIFAGYVLSRAMTTTQAAEAIADAARHYVEPDRAALQEVETVGTAVRGQINILNEGLDAALMRLAQAEAMIRQHVDAIETAGTAIEMRTTDAVERVVSERSRLMELTETLNSRADDFAVAIAERTEANITAMERSDVATQTVQSHFEDRLSGLEKAAGSALESFQSLVSALGEADTTMQAGTGALVSSAEQAELLSARTKEAAEASKHATKEAVQQAVMDASAMANLDTVKTAVSQINDKAGEQALVIAREEARKIAEEAVKSAGLEIEKIAKQAGETIESTAEQAAEAARVRKLALTKAHAELEEENTRLERLIDEQQARAERLAATIALQTEKLANAAAALPPVVMSNEDHEENAGGNAPTVSGPVNQEETPKVSDTTPHKAAIEAPAFSKAPLSPPPAQPFFNGDGHKGAKVEQDTDGSEKKPILKWPSTRDAAKKGPAADGARPKQRATLEDADQSIKTPQQDLERLGELARDLAERRAGKSLNNQDLNNQPSSSRSSEDKTSGTHEHGDQPMSVSSSVQSPSEQRGNKSWKDILAAAEDAGPLDLTPQDRQDELVLKSDAVVQSGSAVENERVLSNREQHAIDVIERLQDFTSTMDMRLYGASPPGLVERFERGDRNIFANRLLRLNESDLKKRIRHECARDRDFEKGIKQFLSDFDRLLEDAAQSDNVDDELREYLGSPLGRMYLLIGEIVGYFA